MDGGDPHEPILSYVPVGFVGGLLQLLRGIILLSGKQNSVGKETVTFGKGGVWRQMCTFIVVLPRAPFGGHSPAPPP